MTPLTLESLEAIQEAGSPLLRALFILAAMAASGMYFARDTAHWPLDAATRRKALMATGLGAVVGATLPSPFMGGVVGELSQHFLLMGPRTILGGMLGGFFGIALYKRFAKVPFDTSDGFVRSLAIGMVFGRVGCHFGHCCIGRESELGMARDFGDGVMRLPAQGIEAGVMLIVFLVFDQLHRRDLFPGKRLFMFYATYGLLRLWFESLRAPVTHEWQGLALHAWLALLLFAVGVFEIIKRSFWARDEGHAA